MTTATFTVSDAVQLAEVVRSGFVESRHAGSAVVLGSDGQVIRSLGSTESPVLARSALKPLLAVGTVLAGAALADETLALATASHVGSDRHAEGVRDLLLQIGLNEDALKCPAAWPEDSDARAAMIRRDDAPSPLRHNCSGKHAAMLAACVASGWPVESYLDPRSPLQVHLLEVVERLLGEKVSATAVDGCGAPVHAMTLRALARALNRIGTASARSPFALHRTGGSLVAAVRSHPWAIRGEGVGDSLAVAELGVFAKFGAEGVQVMVAPDGTTVALKMLDGSTRAGEIVAVTLLEQAGALPAGSSSRYAERDRHLVVSGGGAPVGHIRATV